MAIPKKPEILATTKRVARERLQREESMASGREKSRGGKTRGREREKEARLVVARGMLLVWSEGHDDAGGDRREARATDPKSLGHLRQNLRLGAPQQEIEPSGFLSCTGEGILPEKMIFPGRIVKCFRVHLQLTSPCLGAFERGKEGPRSLDDVWLWQ